MRNVARLLLGTAKGSYPLITVLAVGLSRSTFPVVDLERALTNGLKS
jgi:hypothetical protein